MSEEVALDDPRFMDYTRMFLEKSSAAFGRTSIYSGM
jgi:hypothetical protein